MEKIRFESLQTIFEFLKSTERKGASLARPPREGGGDATISSAGNQTVLTGDDVIRLGSCVASLRLFL